MPNVAPVESLNCIVLLSYKLQFRLPFEQDMSSLALSLLFTDTVLRARGTPTVLKAGRRTRFTCISVIAWPVNQEEKNSSHRGRCDITVYSR